MLKISILQKECGKKLEDLWEEGGALRKAVGNSRSRRLTSAAA
jgi:hypothetical protein